jgi:hypothetical protein
MLNDTPEVPVGFLGGLAWDFIAPIHDASKSHPQFWVTLTSPLFLDNLKSYFGAAAGILLTLLFVYVSL